MEGKNDESSLRRWGERLSWAQIDKDLYPGCTYFYIQEVPELDAWGHPFEFWAVGEHHPSFLIRSPGSDGVFQQEAYQAGTFSRSDKDNDIVWVDGRFLRRPEKLWGQE